MALGSERKGGAPSPAMLTLQFETTSELLAIQADQPSWPSKLYLTTVQCIFSIFLSFLRGMSTGTGTK